MSFNLNNYWWINSYGCGYYHIIWCSDNHNCRCWKVCPWNVKCMMKQLLESSIKYKVFMEVHCMPSNWPLINTVLHQSCDRSLNYIWIWVNNNCHIWQTLYCLYVWLEFKWIMQLVWNLNVSMMHASCYNPTAIKHRMHVVFVGPWNYVMWNIKNYIIAILLTELLERAHIQ